MARRERVPSATRAKNEGVFMFETNAMSHIFNLH